MTVQAENENLRAQVQRLEQEVRSLKEEAMSSTNKEIHDLKAKYDDMKVMYNQLQHQSEQDAKISTLANRIHQVMDGDTVKQLQFSLDSKGGASVSDQKYIGEETRLMKSPGAEEQKLASTTANLRPAIKKANKRRRNSACQTKQEGPKAKDKEEVEVWKLRCKFLAEKYFNALKDLKSDLKELKARNYQDIQTLQKELGTELISQLKAHLKRMEVVEENASKKSQQTVTVKESRNLKDPPVFSFNQKSQPQLQHMDPTL